MKLIAYYGRIVIMGNRGEIEINPRLAMEKESTMVGMALWNAPEKDYTESLYAVSAYLESGVLKPQVGDEYQLSEAITAHKNILDSSGRGKMILNIER